jgi:hypothetical protein
MDLTAFSKQADTVPDGDQDETDEETVVMLENELYERMFKTKLYDNSKKYGHLDGSFECPPH